MRSAFGQPNANPASRFLDEVPDELVDWRRSEEHRPSAPPRRSAGSASAAGPRGHRPRRLERAGALAQRRRSASTSGDRVNHDKYGLGTVVASDGVGVRATVTIDFGSAGTVRLMLIGGVPLQKL